MDDVPEISDIYSTHQNFRQYLIDDLRRKIFGPHRGASAEDKAESLPLPPLQIYSTGVLFPQKLVQNKLEEASESESVSNDIEVDDGDLEDQEFDSGSTKKTTIADDASSSDVTEPLNLANEFSPSAAGISFRLEEPTEIQVSVSYGTYEQTRIQEPNPKAGKVSLNGTVEPEFRDATVYKRTHHEPDPMIVGVPSGLAKLDPIAIGGESSDLKLHVTCRPRQDNTIIVSAMVVNPKIASTDQHSAETIDCFFQVEISVKALDGSPIFLPIDRDGGGAADDDELLSLELLYLHRRAFALGHGIAGDWNRDEKLSESGKVDRVEGVVVPVYELKPIRPREKALSDIPLDLRMSSLAGEGENAECKHSILSAVKNLSRDYQFWIEEIEEKSNSLNSNLKKAAEKHVRNCRACLDRINIGIETLESDDQALTAFRLMNRSMLIQQFHSSLRPRTEDDEFPDIPENYAETPGKERAWRPFQLAFVLMNIRGMVEQGHPDKSMVDLIWFPTGGGKTEAYLGLASFTILFERMSGRGEGTVVLMRYTLRLLTAQQFQRASALTLALESIRKDKKTGVSLGDAEISIGLWVGESLSPNNRADARSALKKLKNDKFASNPFQVLNCPWCGLKLSNRENLGYHDEKLEDGSKTVKISCPDSECQFNKAQNGLPIYVIDEDLYSAPPTLLIGTVDKFAQISWKNEAGSFFGLGSKNLPPALVIQDELHLISGPLGTMVGLYETAIDRLCARGGHVHKIVASTATIRRAEQQCFDLYARKTFEFPAQGIRAGDSYFAYEDVDSPGRLYLGVMGSAVKSHQTSLVRACSPLLQAVCYPNDEGADGESAEMGKSAIEKIVDPYGTLVWYFNSLRELGHAATLCNGDIPEHLKSMCSRLNIPYEQRRYISEKVELTSRRTADEIPEILDKLGNSWRMGPKGAHPIDVLLATNMIAVGVDVPRLGLIVMSGQPKSASEYIQATSRVGRLHPGLVVTVYTQTKSRDRSHYERFVAYHQSIYRHVEPTSVTPFSPQARERGMRGLLIALARQLADVKKPDQIATNKDKVAEEIKFILERVDELDDDELEDAEAELFEWLKHWSDYKPPEYGKMGGKVDTATLAFPFGSARDPEHQEHAWPIMTSMRNVDGTCSARVVHVYQSDISPED